MAAALRTHPTLAEARAASEVARAETGMAGAWPNPTLDAAFAHGRADNGPAGSEHSWSLVQPLPWPGRRGASVRAAQAAAATADARIARTEADVAQEAALLFLDTYLAQRRAGTLAESASALESLAALLKRRVDAGEGRPLDAVRAAVEAGRFRLEAERARAEATGLYAQLQLAAGGSLPAEADLVLPPPGASPPLPLEDLQAALDQRSPDLAEASAAREAARLQLESERRAWWPDLDLGAFRNEEVDKISSGATLTLGLPIFWRNRYGVARAEAEIRLAAAERDAERLRRSQELVDAYAAWQAARRQRGAFESEILPAARRAVEIAEYSLQQGETSLLDALDGRRSWLAVTLDAEAARVDEVRERLRVERLIGRNAP